MSVRFTSRLQCVGCAAPVSGFAVDSLCDGCLSLRDRKRENVAQPDQDSANRTFAELANARGGSVADAGETYTMLLDLGAPKAFTREAYRAFVSARCWALWNAASAGNGSPEGESEYLAGVRIHTAIHNGHL